MKNFTITASVRDAAGRIGTDVVKVKVDKHGTSGQALTPAPTAVTGDGLDDYDGPEVTLVGPRDPSSLALGTRRGARVHLLPGLGASTGPAPASASTRTVTGSPHRPWGSFVTRAQFASARRQPQLPRPGIHLRRGFSPRQRGNRPGRPEFGAGVRYRGKHAQSPRKRPRHYDRIWVAGGRFVMPAGKTTVTVTARVTDNAGKTGSVSRTFGVSAVANGQLLTPQP